MQFPRFGAGAVTINGNIFVLGGSNDGKTFSSVEIYDPVTNTWELGIPMIGKRKWISVNTYMLYIIKTLKENY